MDPVAGLVRGGDADAGESGTGQPVAVLGEGGGPGNAADRLAVLAPLERGEAILGEMERIYQHQMRARQEELDTVAETLEVVFSLRVA